MPHLLILTPADGDIHVTLQSEGATVAKRIVPFGDLKPLITRADSLLSRGGGQYPTRHDLLVFGRELADTLLGPDILPALLALRGRLWIVSTDADLLNLPLELIPRDPASFLIEGGHLLLRRTADPAAATAPAETVTRPGPLRVLFMACSPQDENRLAFEKEEEIMVKLSLRAGDKIHLNIAESGTFEELENEVASYRPHIVHLSGHAALDESGIGYFCFEDERGMLDLRSAVQITNIFATQGVAMVFVSGCETARNGLFGLCQALVRSGHVPLALGWGMPVIDSLATLFAESLFRQLADGASVDASIIQARGRLLEECYQQDDSGNKWLLTDFALPRLHAANCADLLYDGTVIVHPPRPTFRHTMLPDRIVGLKEGFVGRRRILQRTLPILRDADDGKTILLLTGIGGAGKSTLTTRLATRLQLRNGLKVVALRQRHNEQPEAFVIRVLKQIEVASLSCEPPHPLTAKLTGDDYGLPQRIDFAIEVLNCLPLLLVLDNLESLMPSPPAPPKWLHTAFGIFFTELTQRLTGQSRAILTCRYVPSGFSPPTQEDCSPVLHFSMPDFTEADFFKCAEYHKAIASRLSHPDDKVRISRQLLADFYRKLGATPRFVKQALSVLGQLPSEKIIQSLSKIGDHTPTSIEGDTENDIRNLQQDYFASLFLPELFQALSSEHRLALSCLAVSELALPLDGCSAIMDLPAEDAAVAISACIDLGLLQSFDDREGSRLHSIYPLQRSFLLENERISVFRKETAHLALAGWLSKLAEDKYQSELGVSNSAVHHSCLFHASAGSDFDLASWAATRIGNDLFHRSEFRNLSDFANGLITRSRHRVFFKLAADAQIQLGNLAQARDLLLEAATGFAAADDAAGKAGILHQIATIDVHEGNYPSARDNFHRSLQIMQTIGDSMGEAKSWFQLASIHLHEESYVVARDNFLKAQEIYKNNDAHADVASTWHHLAIIDFHAHDYTVARDNLLKALKMRQAIPDRVGEAATWQQLAYIDVHECNFPAARESFQKSLETSQAIGDRSGEATTWQGLATTDFREGNYPGARENFRKSLEIGQAIGNRAGEAMTWKALATLVGHSTGAKLASLHLAAVAWNILKSIGSAQQEAALNNLAAMASELSLTPEALGEEIQSALASYQQDRGADLLAAAFPSNEDS